MPEYIYLIHPFRHEFFSAPTPAEEQVMEAHSQYLERATSAGKVLLAGPCLDETFGLVAFTADNDQAARDFMLDDPAVSSNVMMAELHPIKITMKQGC